MRTRPAAHPARLLLATAVVAALAATATACGSGNDDAAGSAPTSSTAPASPLAPSPSAAAPSSAPSAGAPSAAASSNGGTSSTGGGSSTGGSGNDVASSGGKTPFCHTADLTMQAKNTSPDSRTGDVTVLMTNRGSGTCSAAGFAGADLKDSDGTSVSVARGREVPKITDLKPGQTASFSISYSVDTSGDHLYNPVAILTTPPNETHSVSLKWPAGAPALAGPYGNSTIQVHPVAIEG